MGLPCGSMSSLCSTKSPAAVRWYRLAPARYRINRHSRQPRAYAFSVQAEVPRYALRNTRRIECRARVNSDYITSPRRAASSHLPRHSERMSERPRVTVDHIPSASIPGEWRVRTNSDRTASDFRLGSERVILRPQVTPRCSPHSP